MLADKAERMGSISVHHISTAPPDRQQGTHVHLKLGRHAGAAVNLRAGVGRSGTGSPLGHTGKGGRQATWLGEALPLILGKNAESSKQEAARTVYGPTSSKMPVMMSVSARMRAKW